jgi:hypothetical protein
MLESSIGEPDEEFYQVETILDKKKQGKKTLYLVKWEGYSVEESTWEPISNLKNVKDMVKLYEEALLKRPNETTKD